MPAADTIATLDMTRLQAGYCDDAFGPVEVADTILKRIAKAGENNVWTARVDDDALMKQADALARLPRNERGRLTLFGIPFAVKDNIDVEGFDTTAGCADFAYRPRASAPIITRLRDAGALLIGKTNLDQFATGLTGTRSPFGAPRNPFNAAYIPGGSSSGSAVAVASGFASFALGTDTAGSGRVPAGFTNLIGFKPTRGLVSMAGIVPACRSLDCIAVFALSAGDAARVFEVMRGRDVDDPYARGQADQARLAEPSRFEGSGDFTGVRLAVPREDDLDFCGDDGAAHLFAASIERAAALGADIRRIDFSLFLEAAQMLYGGPWMAERTVAIAQQLERNPDAILPVTRATIEQGADYSAMAAFEAFYKLQALRQKAMPVFDEAHALLMPTTPTIFTIAEIEAEPVKRNNILATYTNFLNLFDMCGIAVPAGFYPGGLPFGVTFASPALQDADMLALARVFQERSGIAGGMAGVKQGGG